MELLISLWLPIVLSGVGTWIAATVLSMPFLHHKGDFIGLDEQHPAGTEDALLASLRAGGIRPGSYLFPDFRAREAMESEKVKQALEAGPVGHLVLWKTPMSMGAKMAGTLAVYLATSALIGYLASITLERGASFERVFQVVATAGVLTYTFASLPGAIWWGSYRRTIGANIIDGLVLGAITGAVFAWRWPR
ncbi:MAG TPA: hypothetical protein VD997_04010 [Phycisphaerales bacterium]|nr:hypothetical protein [Phycisphaerales bacterium]